MLFLRQVRRKLERIAAGRARGAANRQAADLLRRGQISLEQGRREVADRDVIEAVARLVARQQRGDIDIDGQQVADGVLIFGAVEAAEGVGAAWVGMGGGGADRARFRACETSAS